MLLSLLIFSPLVGMLGVLLCPADKPDWSRRLGILAAAVPLCLATVVWLKFDPTGPAFQMVERVSWIAPFSIEYFLGVDGLSVPLLFLTALLCFLGLLASSDIASAKRGYTALFLFLETGLLGVFAALDFFLFFVFWEVMLLPMYFLIGIWGGKARAYSAMKFFLYTLFGSVLLLLVVLGMYFYSEPHTFDLTRLAVNNGFSKQVLPLFGHNLPLDKVFWILLFVGFAIKIPVWPFHTWLPWAHVEAPTAVSVVLAGVLLKMGSYGLLRVNYALLPEASAWASSAVLLLAIVGILYGALCALAQSDLKRLVAYSSVSHMGFVLLGIASGTAAGFLGASLQMFNHGTSTGLLFLLVGMLYERAGHRNIVRADGSLGFGGLTHAMPRYAAVFGFTAFAALGLPGLANFVGEALILLGTFSVVTPPAGVLLSGQMAAALAALGVVLGAAYLLWAYMRVFLGPPREGGMPHFSDLSAREWGIVLPLMFLILLFGLWPSPLIKVFQHALLPLLAKQGA